MTALLQWLSVGGLIAAFAVIVRYAGRADWLVGEKRPETWSAPAPSSAPRVVKTWNDGPASSTSARRRCLGSTDAAAGGRRRLLATPTASETTWIRASGQFTQRREPAAG